MHRSAINPEAKDHPRVRCSDLDSIWLQLQYLSEQDVPMPNGGVPMGEDDVHRAVFIPLFVLCYVELALKRGLAQASNQLLDIPEDFQNKVTACQTVVLQSLSQSWGLLPLAFQLQASL